MRSLKRLRFITSLFILLTIPLLAACAGNLAGAAESGGVEASGFIEAETINILSEVPGRVAEVRVDEADIVEAGDALILLDDALLQADRLQALAALQVAEANLEAVQADPTEEEIARAESLIAEAEANLEGAQIVAGQAWGAASNPQNVQVQVSAAETERDLSLQQVNLLLVRLEEERVKLDYLLSRTDDPATFWVNEGDDNALDIEFQRYTIQTLEAQVRGAEAAYQGALKKLELLQGQAARPLDLIAAAQQASGQVGVFEAQIALAEAGYRLITADATPEDIAIAQAQVDLARANLAIVDARIARLTLIAPISGRVTNRSISVGETASAGISLMTVADLETLKLTIYVPETALGQVQLGAGVSIRVDAYPDETFTGNVVFISREAEFTPRNVQTEEERVNLVFGVEILIDNADGRLKPGMPADVIIAAE
jgi:HlyD family secretion protein